MFIYDQSNGAKAFADSEKEMRKTAKQHLPLDENETGELLKIGDVARESNIGIEALRFYERSGLLDRPARTASGYRMYDRAVLERLEFIKRAQVLGFTLHEIKELIAHKKAGESPCDEVRGIVRQRLAELDERMKETQLYRSELAATLAEWESRGDAEGHICGLIEHSEIEHSINQKRKIGKEK